MARLIDSLVGQRETLTPLLQAASENRLAPTLLFSGPSGIGKKLCALILAQRLVCEKPQGVEACGECGACLRMAKEQSESLLIISPDGAQIKIEQARDVLQFLQLRGLGRARVIIIDQAHLLGPQAANALLKVLEEPPSGTYFILVTPVAATLLPTIRSRSQLIRFKPLEGKQVQMILKKTGAKEVDAWVINSAQGSVEAALRLSESREEYTEIEDVVAKYLAEAPARFPSAEITQLRDLMKERPAQGYVLRLIQGVFRDTLRVQAGVAMSGDPHWSDLVKGLAAFPNSAIQSLNEQAQEIEYDLGRNVDRGLVLENFALKIKQAATSRMRT